MTRPFLILSAVSLLGTGFISSCADKEDVSHVENTKAIRFAAQSPSLTRAEQTTANLSEFAVYAYTEGVPFMKNVQVTKSSTGTWEYNPVVYWPGTPVNFYAYSPMSWHDVPSGEEPGGEPTLTPGSGVAEYYSQYGNVDLIYAVNMNQEQSAEPVLFNFRHALSQVLINLRTDVSDNLDIRVTNVVLHGVRTQGEFTFPSATTAAGGSAQGTWSGQTGEAEYIYMMGGTATDPYMTLTSDAQSTNMACLGFLMPQTLGTFNITATPLPNTQYATGDFISLDVNIYSKTTGELVWPNEDTPAAENIDTDYVKTGRLYFPLIMGDVTEWQPGVRYNYTITINEPSTLTQIQFGAPTVDTYQEVTVNTAN